MGSNIDHEIANCLECGKRWEGENARKKAAAHSRATKHRTLAEVAMVYRYGPPMRPDWITK